MALARAGVERGCDAFKDLDELLGRNLGHEDGTGVFRVAEQVLLTPELHTGRAAGSRPRTRRPPRAA